MDAKGRYITASDGYIGSPGDLYLFDAYYGNPLVLPGLQATQAGAVPVWPMQISGDGSAIVAGDDNGWVYYFAMPTAGWQPYRQPFRLRVPIFGEPIRPGPIDPGPLRQIQVVLDRLDQLALQITEMNDRLSRIESSLPDEKLK
jgi:hypothetical protein